MYIHFKLSIDLQKYILSTDEKLHRYKRIKYFNYKRQGRFNLINELTVFKHRSKINKQLERSRTTR